MPKRISLTPQQRGELVLRLLRKEATASELAREQSISENTLYKWRAAFLEAGFGGLGETRGLSGDVKVLERELAERDQVIGEQTVAIRVLKKSLGLSA